MQIDKISRKVRLGSVLDAVEYQLITELVFLRKMQIIYTDLTYLSYLVLLGPMSLKEFCHKMVVLLHGTDVTLDPNKYPVRMQTVRNRLNALEKRGLVVKQGKKKKLLMFTPSIEIRTTGNILLDYNFLYVDTKENQRVNTRDREEVATL